MKEWKMQFRKNILSQGKDYYERGRVFDLQEKDGVYTAAVIERKRYNIRIIAKQDVSYKMSCSCPLAKGGGNCRHMAAVLYALEAQETADEGTDMDLAEVEVDAVLKKNEEREDTPYEPDEGEYFVLSESGLAKETSKESVREEEEKLNPVLWESYTYLDFEKIWESFGFSEKVLRRGKQLQKNGDVRITNISPGYVEDRDEQIVIVEGVGKDGALSFPMRMFLLRTEFLYTGCECKECESNYWRYYGKSKCAHIAALMRLAEIQMRENPVGNATDKQGTRLLYAFRQSQANQVMSGVMGQEEDVMLVPRLVEREGELSLSFKIGTRKLYVIKDLTEFYINVKNSSTQTYGKNEQINHAVDNFTDMGKRWITFIGNVVQEEAKFEGRLIEARTYYSKKALAKKNELELFGWRIDRFYEIAARETIAYENRPEKIKTELTFAEANPGIKMTIRKNTMDSMRTFHGITAECKFPFMFYGTKTVYFINGNKFCRMQEDFAEKIRPMMEYAEGTKLSFRIGRNELADFYHMVVDELRDVIDIEDVDREEIEKYLPPEAEFVFYLDTEKNSVTCRPSVRYGGYEILLLDQHPDQAIPREHAKEQKVLFLLRQWLPYEDSDKGELYSGESEELVYQFLAKGVGALLELGEVQCTRRFSNLNMARQIKLSAGVSVSSGLLNLEISAEDISQEELLDILNSYRSRKKYHRLKNGDFLGLEDDSVKMLDEMMSAMHLSPKEFIKGRIQLPLYRTLYLDKMLEENESIYTERDEYFRNLVREYKTVNDSDFRVPVSLNKVMRNYQKKGYKWLRTLESCQFGGILADDMGLGKTLQVIAVLLAARKEKGEGTSLVVAPASLVFNWGEEMQRFAPELEYCLVTGSRTERKQKIEQYQGFDVLVTSYDLLKRDAPFYEGKEFLYQIIDEAQYIKNHTTSAAKAVKIIHSRTRYALTGTPIENRLSELWSIFDYLMPGFLYGYETFKKEFELPIVKNGDAGAMERLQKMVTPFILRRLKENVLRDLPDKLEKTHYIQFQKEQQNLYDAQVVHMRQTLAGQDEKSFQKTRIKIFAELMRLRQICCDPGLCFENYTGESAKLEACMDLLESAIEGGHKILLFSQFTSMLEIIRQKCVEKGISFYTITGETPKEKRLKLVKEFNGDKTEVFLISLKAGGLGLNLTGADVVVHYDPWWNFAVQNQATDRAYRIGQDKKVTVYRLIAKGSIEEKIVKLQETKKDLSDQIVQGDGNSLSGMSREDFIELLG